LSQIGFGLRHWRELQQSPSTQTCAEQQTWPGAQSPWSKHCAHKWNRQMGWSGLVHWASVQQLPAKHCPSQQIANSPSHVLRSPSSQHSLQTSPQACGLSGGQATQVWSAQMGVGSEHCWFVQQFPLRHVPSQQISPAPHWSSAVHPPH
jgi:hypothetical protein